MEPQTQELLLELARAVQRYGMYPEGHPSRETTAATLGELLRRLLEREVALPIRISRNQLRVGGEATDPANTLLRSLATRLNEHQLHRVVFSAGLKDDEMMGFLTEVSRPVGKMGEPLGASPPEQLTRWPSVSIEAVPYSAISLADGTEAGTFEEGGAGIPEGMGGAEGSGGGGPEGAGGSRWGVSDGLASRIGDTVLKLSGESRRRLHAMLKEVLEAEGVDGSAGKAIEHLVQSAGRGADSSGAATMLRVIASFSSDASSGISPDAVLGELVDQLSADQGEGVGAAVPAGGGDGAGQEALGGTGMPGVRAEWVGEPEPERILQIAVEIEEASPLAHGYLNRLLEAERGIRRALDVLEEAPAGNTASDAMMDWVAGPRSVRRLLESAPPDLDTLDRLLPRLGVSLAKPMLEVLMKTDSEEVRAGIAERLVSIGTEAGPLVVARLKDSRWEIRHTLLAVLGRLDELPEDFSLGALMGDPDPRVRRLAMDLDLERGGDRATVLDMAVRDPDPEIWRFGFERVMTNCPPALVARLAEMAGTSRYTGGQRLAAIRALGATRGDQALAVLLELAWQRKIFRIYGLRPKSSEMLEALGTLRRHWSGDPRVEKVLAKARRSRDAQIRSLGGRKEATG